MRTSQITTERPELQALIVAGALVLIALVISIFRFGLSPAGAFSGDGSGVIAAAGALLGLWGVIVTLGATAMLIVFEVAPLPFYWKWHLAKSESRLLLPTVIVSVIAGAVPFLVLVNERADSMVLTSATFHWLILGLILQPLTIWSSVRSAQQLHRALQIPNAVDRTLQQLTAKLDDLRDSHWKAYAKDPFGELHGLGVEIGESDASEADVLLMTAFAAALTAPDRPSLRTSLGAVDRWLQTFDSSRVKALDAYFANRLIPHAIANMGEDQRTLTPAHFGVRVFAAAKLLRFCRDRGFDAVLVNAMPSFTQLLSDFAAEYSPGLAFEKAREAISVVLSRDPIPGKILILFLATMPRRALHGGAHPREVIGMAEHVEYWIEEYFRAVASSSNSRHSDVFIVAHAPAELYEMCAALRKDPLAGEEAKSLQQRIAISVCRAQDAVCESDPPTEPSDRKESEKKWLAFEELRKSLASIAPLPIIPSDYRKYSTNPYATDHGAGDGAPPTHG